MNAILNGFLSRWQLYVGLAALLAGSHTLALCKGIDIEQDRQAARELAKAEKARTLDDKATEQRATDTADLQEKDNARTDAIEAAPDDVTDAPGAALACQRLRNAGRSLPPACGR